MTKKLQKADKVITSLIALRDELESDRWKWTQNVDRREILFKINSCLYDQYPVHGVALKGTHE